MASLWQATSTPPETDPWTDGGRCDVAVVGAGITGLATAAELVRRGLDVVVLEARRVGAVTTGNTTAKVSLLQGGTLSTIRSRAGAEAARSYLATNRAGQDWWRETVGLGADLQVRDALTYATTSAGHRRMVEEHEASREAGLPVEAVGPEAMEYAAGSVVAVLRLRDQLQAHPTRVLARLTEQVRAGGARVVEGVRVTGADVGDPTTLGTTHGVLRARHVVLATGTPVLDRRGHFARLEPQRSYAVSYRRGTGPLPQGMYLSLDKDTRSVRSVPVDGEELLLVGGAGHLVGRARSAREHVETLQRWAATTFDGVGLTHAWSAQDYRSDDALPIVGPLAHGDTRVLVATGFGKWGMTNGAAAALALTGWVTGEVPGWARDLADHDLSVGRATSAVRYNAGVAAHLASGLVGGAVRPLPDEAPAEGCGVVGRDGARLVARSTVDGQTRRVSAHCTHLGAVLGWNDEERSWDCPLHGSRFSADGQVLEGPATSPLGRV